MGTVRETEHISPKTKNTSQPIKQAGELCCLWQAVYLTLCQSQETDDGSYLAQVSSKTAIPRCLATQLTRTCLPLSIVVGSLVSSTPSGT